MIQIQGSATHYAMGWWKGHSQAPIGKHIYYEISPAIFQAELPLMRSFSLSDIIRNPSSLQSLFKVCASGDSWIHFPSAARRPYAIADAFAIADVWRQTDVRRRRICIYYRRYAHGYQTKPPQYQRQHEQPASKNHVTSWILLKNMHPRIALPIDPRRAPLVVELIITIIILVVPIQTNP